MMVEKQRAASPLDHFFFKKLKMFKYYRYGTFWLEISEEPNEIKERARTLPRIAT
jgi:hypothetical protein